MDIGLQTSEVELRSMVNQTSKQDVKSLNIQTSEIEMLSNRNQTSLYGPNAPIRHTDTQTDPRITRTLTPHKKRMGTQTVKPKDAYKEDWERSAVYRRALKEEAMKRNLEYIDPLGEQEDNISD